MAGSEKDKEKRNQMRQAGVLTGLPFSMVGAILVGFGLGWLGDRKFGTEPWLLLAGGFLGIAAAFKEVFELLKKMQK